MNKTGILIATVAIAVAFAGDARGAVVLSDDFDPIDNGNFATLTNAAALGSGLQGFLSGNALHFGRQSGTTPFATTVAVDVSSGGTIEFNFRGGNEGVDGSSYWEDSDGSGEWADLSYSTDGSTFTNFQVLNTEINERQRPTVWLSFNIAIPVLAQTANTQFRFAQRGHSGASFDHWAIDNLVISNNDAVPEPSSLAILGIASMGLVAGGIRRRRKQRS